MRPLILVKARPLAHLTLVTVFRQVAELKLILDVVVMHECSLVCRASPGRKSAGQEWALHFAASARLHAASCGEAGYRIGRRAVCECRAEVAVAVGVVAREIEEVYAGEDDKESAEEGYCVYSGCGVEALEEEERCDEGAGGEGYIVKRVDAAEC